MIVFLLNTHADFFHWILCIIEEIWLTIWKCTKKRKSLHLFKGKWWQLKCCEKHVMSMQFIFSGSEVCCNSNKKGFYVNKSSKKMHLKISSFYLASFKIFKCSNLIFLNFSHVQSSQVKRSRGFPILHKKCFYLGIIIIIIIR